MNNNYELTAKDLATLDDSLKEFKGTIISGRVQIEDKFGNVILDKHNLVVLQGRGFILKKLFFHPDADVLDGNKVISGSGNTDVVVNAKTIPILFTVGGGGVSSIENPTAFTPKYDDKSITSLFDSGTDILGDGVTTGKKFNKIEYKNDSDTNETYILLTLTIKQDDFASGSTPVINEAGILFGEATFDSADNLTAVKKLTLMSRITFDSIPINSGDSFTIKYYLYA